MIHLIKTLSLMDLIKILLKNSNAGYTIQRDVKTNLILDVIQKSLIWNQENKAIIKLRKSKKNLLKTFSFSHFTSLTFPRRAISKRFRLANRFCNIINTFCMPLKFKISIFLVSQLFFPHNQIIFQTIL